MRCVFSIQRQTMEINHTFYQSVDFFLGIGYLAVLSTHFTLILSSLTTVIQTHLKLIVEVL